MRVGLAISSVGHAVLLGWGLITFAPQPLEAPPTEAMPIDIVPIEEITRMRAGKRDASKQEEPKQKAEKAAEAKPQQEPEKKTPQKPEPKTVNVPPPPPPPLAPELKPKETKSDPIKEVLAKDTPPAPLPPKKPQKSADAGKAPATKQREFNPDKIAALLDKREPQRQQAAAEAVSPVSSLGTATGNAPRLTQSEIDALRAQIQACWNPPIGAENAQELIVRVRIQFRSDGTLAREPELISRGTSTYFQVAAESAMRAVRRCQPYSLPAHKYDVWKDVEVTFDPRDMFGG